MSGQGLLVKDRVGCGYTGRPGVSCSVQSESVALETTTWLNSKCSGCSACRVQKHSQDASSIDVDVRRNWLSRSGGRTFARLRLGVGCDRGGGTLDDATLEAADRREMGWWTAVAVATRVAWSGQSVGDVLHARGED